MAKPSDKKDDSVTSISRGQELKKNKEGLDTNLSTEELTSSIIYNLYLDNYSKIDEFNKNDDIMEDTNKNEDDKMNDKIEKQLEQIGSKIDSVEGSVQGLVDVSQNLLKATSDNKEKIDKIGKELSLETAEIKLLDNNVKWVIRLIVALLPISVALLGIYLGQESSKNNDNINSLRNEIQSLRNETQSEMRTIKIENSTNFTRLNDKLDAMQKYNKLYIQNEVNKKFLEGQKR